MEVVKDRLRVFGSSGACKLPGNICPTHGVCAEQNTCAIEEPKNVKAPASESESEQTERTISSISSKLSQEDIFNIVTEIVQKVKNVHSWTLIITQITDINSFLKRNFSKKSKKK